MNADRCVDTGNEFSRAGTVQHEWNEKVLSGLPLSEVPEENRRWAEIWKRETDQLIAHGGTAVIEQEIPLFYAVEDVGTVDFAAVNETSIHIRDYKHGEGELVDPVGNTQLAIYALSFIRQLEDVMPLDDDFTVTIGIVQPRYQGEEAVRVWETTAGELKSIGYGILSIVDTINEGDVKFNPGETECRYCPAAAFCNARLTALAAIQPHQPEVLPADVFQVIASNDAISDEQLVTIWKRSGEIRKILDAIHERLFGHAVAGCPAPGTKLVAGRPSNRTWTEEQGVINLLRSRKLKMDEYGTWKLKSPAQVEKLPVVAEALKSTRFRNRFQELITRGEGKPILVPADDPRPALSHGFTPLSDASAAD